jgi:hypothetical protein
MFVFQVKTKACQYFLLHFWLELLRRSLANTQDQFGKMALAPASRHGKTRSGWNK